MHPKKEKNFHESLIKTISPQKFVLIYYSMSKYISKFVNFLNTLLHY